MKRELVVYLLGAGFSAPLGLPVMSNFLEKSKDLFYLKDALTTDQSKCFKEVFEAIHTMSVVKNYYETDLFNIEEILSILTMQHRLGGEPLKKAFLRYIADVIEFYTPEVPRLSVPHTSEWYKGLYSSMGEPGQYYGLFVGSLFQLSISPPAGGAKRYLNRFVDYGVITLNYDLVLERFARSLKANYPNAPTSFFRTKYIFDDGIPLAKLHGSVRHGSVDKSEESDKNVIVAPTWNKEVSQDLLLDWTLAFQLLSAANHLRVIGYSLPTADAYIKYLLRAASIKSHHLKRIDVLCRDDRRNSVRARYEEFVDPARLRFVSGDVTDYLRTVYDASIKGASGDKLELRYLETKHREFFETHAV